MQMADFMEPELATLLDNFIMFHEFFSLMEPAISCHSDSHNIWPHLYLKLLLLWWLLAISGSLSMR